MVWIEYRDLISGEVTIYEAGPAVSASYDEAISFPRFTIRTLPGYRWYARDRRDDAREFGLKDRAAAMAWCQARLEASP